MVHITIFALTKGLTIAYNSFHGLFADFFFFNELVFDFLWAYIGKRIPFLGLFLRKIRKGSSEEGSTIVYEHYSSIGWDSVI